VLVEPGNHPLLTLTSELNVHLYLLQGLPEDEFSSADVLVGEKCLNLVEVKLSGEVAGDGGDDVAHGEAARVELLEDFLPVTLQVPPSRKSTCRIGGNGGQHSLHILPSNLGLVEGHVQVLLNGENIPRLPKGPQQVASLGGHIGAGVPIPAPLPLLGTSLSHPHTVNQLLQIRRHTFLPCHLTFEELLRLLDCLRMAGIQHRRQDLLPQQLPDMGALVFPSQLCVDVQRDRDQHPVDALPARAFCEDVRPGVEVVKDGLPNPETFLVLLEGGRHLEGHSMVQLACQAEGKGIVQQLCPVSCTQHLVFFPQLGDQS